MRENETRIGGLHWGMLSIFEPAEPRPGRLIDQSVVAWRLASITNGGSAFENPRSVIQRTVSMGTGGSNTQHVPHPTWANERARVNYFFGGTLPYDPELLERTTIPIIHRRRRAMTANEVRMQIDEERVRRPGYPTAAEVAEIQRRFHNPAMERAQREYLAQMMRMISEPAPPPGLRESSTPGCNAD